MTPNFQISDFIVDHNNQYIVASKPSGMPCVSDPSGDPNLKNILEAYSKHTLHIITRTDRPVSGLSLFAKSQNAAKNLSQQVREHQMAKTYLAIVENAPKEKEGELTHFLLKSKNNKSLVVPPNTPKSKESKLNYTTLLTLDNYTVLKLELLTGRFHQIRSQLAHIGCSIKGDVKYGARRKNKDRSIGLHAFQLDFTHPTTNERKKYQCLPDTNDSLWKIVVDQGNLQGSIT